MKRYYYLLNGKLYWANSEMPNVNDFKSKPFCESGLCKAYEDELKDWHSSLQPCEITEGELRNIQNYLFHNRKDLMMKYDVLEVTDLVNDENGVVRFRENKLTGINKITKRAKRIREFTKRYLNKPKQVDEASEAVEFAEWLHENYNQTTTGWHYDNWGGDMETFVNYTTNQLYEIFKSK